MYIYGQRKHISADELSLLIDQLKEEQFELSSIELSDILQFITSLCEQLILSNDNNVLEEQETLSDLCCSKNILKKIEHELGDPKGLDGYIRVANSRVKRHFCAKGVITQISANNVFLGIIDNIICSIITKNTLIIKISSQSSTFINTLVEALESTNDPYNIKRFINLIKFKGGDSAYETVLKTKSSKLIIWGGDDTIRSYQNGLGAYTQIKTYGPRISFAIITKAYLNSSVNLYTNLALDISRWGQNACSNVQNIFLEEGIDKEVFINKLGESIDSLVEINTREPNCSVEVLKAIALIDYEQFLGKKTSFYKSDKTFCYEDVNISVEPTILGNTVSIKTFSSIAKLRSALLLNKQYLQSCALGAVGKQRNDILRSLSSSGISRFTFPGKITVSQEGAPHEGSFQLSELTDIITDEFLPSHDDFVSHTREVVNYYNDNKSLLREDIKLGIFSKNNLSLNYGSGFYFTSGATTGTAKVAFYNYNEFNFIAHRLKDSYFENGLDQEDIALNLFFAGNMWSSFSAIQKALEFAGVTQLPLGGNCLEEEFARVCINLNPTVIFGVPGVLVRFARYCQLKNLNIKINKFFYAGEALLNEQRKILERVFGIKFFCSAGYACVDTGIIGYQDSDCDVGEHILFPNIAHLEISQKGCFITSLLREDNPVLNYKLQDKLVWIDKDNGKFKLLGRSDSLVHIWGARISLSELSLNSFQVIIHKDESIEIRTPERSKNLLQTFFAASSDLNQTVSYECFIDKVKIVHSDFHINKRTGKVPQIIDLRLESL